MSSDFICVVEAGGVGVMCHPLLCLLYHFRKNWTQTWTVLHGGVLTFHKDPKSAAPGALVCSSDTDNKRKSCIVALQYLPTWISLNIVFCLNKYTNLLLISIISVVNQLRI